MNGDFKPENAFQQWIKSEMENMKTNFNNHLSHHRLYLKILVAPIVVGLILIIAGQVCALVLLLPKP